MSVRIKKIDRKSKVEQVRENNEVVSSDRSEAKVIDYLLEHPSVLIASVSALVAAISFILNAAVYIKTCRELQFWGLDVSYVKINANQTYAIIIGLVYLVVNFLYTYCLEKLIKAGQSKKSFALKALLALLAYLSGTVLFVVMISPDIKIGIALSVAVFLAAVFSIVVAIGAFVENKVRGTKAPDAGRQDSEDNELTDGQVAQENTDDEQSFYAGLDKLTDGGLFALVTGWLVILIAAVFAYSLFTNGGTRDKTRFPVVEIDGTNYAVVYQTEGLFYLEEAEIDGKNIAINTAKQKIVSSNDLLYEVVEFDVVSRCGGIEKD